LEFEDVGGDCDGVWKMRGSSSELRSDEDDDGQKNRGIKEASTAYIWIEKKSWSKCIGAVTTGLQI